MSNMDNFDKYVKDSLGNYSPVLPEAAWEKLFAERERRKPKGVIWFSKRNIAILAALLFCTTAVVLLTQNKSAEESIVSSTDNNTTNKATSIADTDKLLSEQKTTEADKINTPSLNEAANKNAPGVNGTETSLKTNAVKEKAEVLKTNSNNITGNTNNHNAKKKYFSAAKSYNIQQSFANIADDNADENNTSFFYQPFLNRLNFETDKISALSFKNLSLVNINLKNIPTTPCPQLEMDAAGNKSYWEVYAGPDYAAKRFRDTTNSVYLQKVKASTTFSSAYSAGIRYTKVFNTGVSLRGGINYSQVNEKFTFLQSNIVQVNYIIDPVTGDTTGSYTVRGTRYKTTHNRYRTLDIPLTIGYEMGNGKFHANINAGAVVNLYSWQKGETLDTSYQPVIITTGKGNELYQYKTNIGIGFTAAASLYYKLNETLHILAEPYIRYNLSPMSKDNLSLQEKFTTIGLRLGLRMDIP